MKATAACGCSSELLFVLVCCKPFFFYCGRGVNPERRTSASITKKNKTRLAGTRRDTIKNHDFNHIFMHREIVKSKESSLKIMHF